MKKIKFLAILVLIMGKSVLANSQLEGSYRLKVYFGDSKPFIDHFYLKKDKNGLYRGKMKVPNDFVSDLDGVSMRSIENGKELTFSIKLPPKYHEKLGTKLFYRLIFLHRSPLTISYKQEFVGFVTHYLKGDYRPSYTGSVIGFRNTN